MLLWGGRHDPPWKVILFLFHGGKGGQVLRRFSEDHAAQTEPEITCFQSNAKNCAAQKVFRHRRLATIASGEGGANLNSASGLFSKFSKHNGSVENPHFNRKRVPAVLGESSGQIKTIPGAI
jgi:hypothetical protein